MPRKRLTAQDAFVGVRETTAPEDPRHAPGEAVRPEPSAPAPAQAEESAPSAVVDDAPRTSSRRAAKTAADPDQELAAALAEAQEVLAARTPGDRLTLYLSADLSAELTQVWEEVRERTQVKVGKSLIAGAALRIVLGDPTLRAQAAAMALRDKLGAQ